jgi:hypothetical protein
MLYELRKISDLTEYKNKKNFILYLYLIQNNTKHYL